MTQQPAPPSVKFPARTSTPSKIEWCWKAFDALTLLELYAMLAARSAVFVVEQHCIYTDIDGQDPAAWHLFGLDAARTDRPLAACARVFGPDAADPTVRIGRVLTTPAYRQLGLGKILIDQVMMRLPHHWPDAPVRLHAQAHLEAFYGAFGFVATSGIHLEDDIPHIWMQRDSVARQPYMSLVPKHEASPLFGVCNQQA